MIRTGFEECPACRAKPGSPLLCPECLERRTLYEELEEVEARCRRARLARDEALARVALLEAQLAEVRRALGNPEGLAERLGARLVLGIDR